MNYEKIKSKSYIKTLLKLSSISSSVSICLRELMDENNENLKRRVISVIASDLKMFDGFLSVIRNDEKEKFLKPEASEAKLKFIATCEKAQKECNMLTFRQSCDMVQKYGFVESKKIEIPEVETVGDALEALNIYLSLPRNRMIASKYANDIIEVYIYPLTEEERITRRELLDELIEKMFG